MLYPMECREPQAGVFQGEECSGDHWGHRLGDGLGGGHIEGRETSWETMGGGLD